MGMVTHTKIKPFKCEKCGSRFSKKSSLVRHDDKVHCIPSEEGSHNSQNTGEKEIAMEPIGGSINDSTNIASNITSNLKEEKRSIIMAKKKRPRERFELLKKTETHVKAADTSKLHELGSEMHINHLEAENDEYKDMESLLGKRNIMENNKEKVKLPKTELETHIEKELINFEKIDKKGL